MQGFVDHVVTYGLREGAIAAMRSLYNSNADAFIDHLFDPQRAEDLSQEEFDATVDMTSRFWRLNLTEAHESKMIAFYVKLMESYSISDLANIFWIYNAFSSADVEWLAALDNEAQRILNDAFLNLSEQFSPENFHQIAEFYELYARLQIQAVISFDLLRH